mmetsp:Transcript_18650/g.45891  ORF Transcript_18650/g.45891 Transcript_18650/m.45891 type:complete len:409 (-) Transcript_18650:512-1738(-)
MCAFAAPLGSRIDGPPGRALGSARAPARCGRADVVMRAAARTPPASPKPKEERRAPMQNGGVPVPLQGSRPVKTRSAMDSYSLFIQDMRKHEVPDHNRQKKLAQAVKRLVSLERVRDRLEQERHPGEKKKPRTRPSTISDDEWAAALGTDAQTLMAEITHLRKLRDTLIAANLRYVVSIAQQYQHCGVPLQDLVQEGSIGLIMGVERFDTSQGYALSTYVRYWIKQRIRRAITNQSRNIRLPEHVYVSLNSIRKTIRTLVMELGREPTLGEIAERMDVPEAKVQSHLRAGKQTLSLDVPLSANEEGSKSLSDIIESNSAGPDELLTKDMLRSTLRKELLNKISHVLTAREREVLILRYGLSNEGPVSTEGIRKRLSISSAMIYNVEQRAMSKLRRSLDRSCRDLIHAL